MSATSNSRSGGTRPGGRSARVRAAVLAAALEELITVGYAGFSCEAVAARAGVHKTTVYRRWRNRENLILDLMREQADIRIPIPDTGTFVGDLTAYGMAILANISAPEVAGTIRAIAASADRDPALAAASHRFWAARFDLASEMVARAVARGEISPDTDPAVVMEALNGTIHFRLLMTGRPLDAAFVTRVARMIATGATAAVTT